MSSSAPGLSKDEQELLEVMSEACKLTIQAPFAVRGPLATDDPTDSLISNAWIWLELIQGSWTASKWTPEPLLARLSDIERRMDPRSNVDHKDQAATWRERVSEIERLLLKVVTGTGVDVWRRIDLHDLLALLAQTRQRCTLPTFYCRNHVLQNGIRTRASAVSFARQVLERLWDASADGLRGTRIAARIRELQHFDQASHQAFVASAPDVFSLRRWNDWEVAFGETARGVSVWLGGVLEVESAPEPSSVGTLELASVLKRCAELLEQDDMDDDFDLVSISSAERIVYTQCCLDFSKCPSDHYWSGCWTRSVFKQLRDARQEQRVRMRDYFVSFLNLALYLVSRNWTVRLLWRPCAATREFGASSPISVLPISRIWRR